jgi:hypothetical protein
VLLRRCVAFHESGHCVVAVTLGYPVSWAWISDFAGRMSCAPPQSERDQTIILLAGTIAQHRVAPGSPLSRSDFRLLADLPADHYRAAAERLVDQNWHLIEDVAAALLELGEVSGIEVEQVCRGMQAAWCS